MAKKTVIVNKYVLPKNLQDLIVQKMQSELREKVERETIAIVRDTTSKEISKIAIMEAAKYMQSKTAKFLIKKLVARSIKKMLNDEDMDDIVSSLTMNKIYKKMENAVLVMLQKLD